MNTTATRRNARQSTANAPVAPIPALVEMIPAAVRPVAPEASPAPVVAPVASQTARKKKPAPEPVVIPAELVPVENEIIERRDRIDGIGRKQVVLYFEQGKSLVKIRDVLDQLGTWTKWQKFRGLNNDTVNRQVRLYESAIQKHGNETAAKKAVGEFATLAAACRALEIRMGDPNRNATAIETVTGLLDRCQKKFVELSAPDKVIVRNKLAELIGALV